MLKNKNILLALTVFALSHAACQAAAMRPAKNTERQASAAIDPRAWTELDIVPMPREIRLTDNDLTLDPTQVVLVIGAQAAPKSKTGADWINQRIAAVGGAAPLPIITHEVGLPAGKTALIIGTAADNPLIAMAGADKIVNVGANNPGDFGYEIRRTPDGQKIYLAGADDIGTLYACVTFGEMLKMATGADGARGHATWRAAEIRDWPDYKYLNTWRMVMPPPAFRRPNTEVTQEMRTAWLDELRAEYEWMLRRKENIMCWSIPKPHLKYLRGMNQSQFEALRAGIELGTEYGIGALCYAFPPYAGLKADFPDAGAEHEMQGSKFDAPRETDERKDWWRSWSLPDEFARRTAAELAGYVRKLGFTDVGFHDTDTGGLSDPAEWEKRSIADHKRWGDDYAAATIHRHRIYYEALKKAVPDLRLHFTLYPYSLAIFNETGRAGSPANWRQQADMTPAEVAAQVAGWLDRYSDFWRRLDDAFPQDDVTFVVRENTPVAFANYRKVMRPGRPLFIWYGGRPGDLYPDIFMENFFSTHNDLFSDMRARDPDGVRVIPPRRLIAREYTWNVNTPGVRAWATDDAGLLRNDISDPAGANYTLILPRLARNMFGRPLAGEMAEALSQSLHAFWLFYHSALVFDNATPRQINIFGKGESYYDHFPDKDAALRREQAAATRAAAAMDRAWAKLGGADNRLALDATTLLRVMFLREYAHVCQWVAAIALEIQSAGAAAAAGDAAEAHAALARAREKHAQAVQALTALTGERPPAWADYQHVYTAKTTLDMLGATGKKQTCLTAAAGMVDTRLQQASVPTEIVGELAEHRQITAVRATPPPQIDGMLNDDAWRGARPVETLFVLRGGHMVDTTPTRAWLAFDDAKLYIGLQAGLPPGRAGIADNDRLELYLDARDAGERALLAIARANGKVSFHARENNDWVRLDLPDAKHRIIREKQTWRGELAIPLAAMRTAPSDRWRFAMLRSHVTPAGQEFSATIVTDAGQPANNLLNMRDAFPPIQWTDQPFAPTVRLDIKNPQTRLITLDDGIAIAAQFTMELTADCELDQARLHAELRTGTGRILTGKLLDKKDHILYRWRPERVYEITAVEGDLTDCTLRLIVETRQGKFETRKVLK